jgi:hypothetical protein
MIVDGLFIRRLGTPSLEKDTVFTYRADEERSNGNSPSVTIAEASSSPDLTAQPRQGRYRESDEKFHVSASYR